MKRVLFLYICLTHDYDTLYCLFVDFSVPCGKPSMYLYG